MTKSDPPLTYKAAGVDIDAGNALVQQIKPLVAKTHRPEVIAPLGGFAGLFALDKEAYEQPLLVSATDGVGTKLKLAIDSGQHQTIGIDLVAMCVNDLILCGADPLFFLDYYATGKLEVAVATDVIAGIAEGCQQAGAALIGGETAEMPGLYQAKDYDLAGFCVGMVDKPKLITGETIQPGDQLIGLASSGLHANGYSLVHHLLASRSISLEKTLEEKTLLEHLLVPTRIYVNTIRQLKAQITIKGMAHITGGGFLENIPRILPANTCAKIQCQSWPQSALFAWLQQEAQLSTEEMFRTFNNGIGLVLCVSDGELQHTLDQLQQQGEQAWHIGSIVQNEANQPQVRLKS